MSKFIFFHKSRNTFGGMNLQNNMLHINQPYAPRLHARSARMQSIPPQSGVMPCGSHRYRGDGGTLPTVAGLRPGGHPVAGDVGRKKNLGDFLRGFLTYIVWGYYIMPPIPPPPIGGIGAGFSSFLSAITHSVDRNIPATEAAF
jgi:hypothetical protein